MPRNHPLSPEGTAKLHLRVPKNLLKELKRLSKELGLSVSQIVRDALYHYLEGE